MGKRIICILLAVALWLVAAKGFAQNVVVNIQMDNISLEQLLTEIERQTNLRFLYRYENIAGKKTTVHAENTAVSIVLENALKANGLRHTMQENNLIVVAPEVSVATQAVKQVVTGQIIDAADGEPVPGAAIFIANTTIGTIADAAGNYSLTVPGRGSFEIVVSHVGYQSVFHKVDIPQNAHQHNVGLIINELDEFVVMAAQTYKKSDVDLFWRKILGETPSKRGMEVLNPEKVYFYKSGTILKASCREPVEIVNHYTGYHIRYVLQRFEYDYRDESVLFDGMPYFEELTTQSNRQKERWEQKRQEVYAVSLNCFLRALYRQQIHEEGFLLANTIPMVDKTRISPVTLEDILQVGKDAILVDIRNPLVLVCYTRPVIEQMIRDCDIELFKRDATPIVVDLMPQRIIVYPDGTYSGLLRIREYENSLIGLSKKVPVEYPETIQNPSYDLTPSPSYDPAMVEENMTAQLEAWPQEKIHLHTDRDFYVPGEKIWLKAYVVDANSHRNAVDSWYVYVELISPADTLVNRVMITQSDGMFYGNLPIADNIPAGNYTLRAYTRHMENIGDDYFFKKNIRIAGSEGNRESRGNVEMERRGERLSPEQRNRENDFDVAFFPEGGNMPEGVSGKVAFKALNKTGYPETVSGKIIDENGVELASVSTYHAGMGVFAYRPEQGKNYYLKCVNENGFEKQFEIPAPHPNVRSLAVSMQNKRLLIGAHKSVQAPDTPCFLLVHSRGTVIYFSEWDIRQIISLQEEELPAGVIQCVLFDSQMNPLSERLVFNKNDATIPVVFQTNTDACQTRDKIAVTLSLPDSLFYSLNGHFSIAVTDDKDVAVDESVTILSSLLLSSELRGYIENPACYLQDDVAMDLLMMTHGWRRYNVPEMVQGRLETPQVPFQEFQGISGRVSNRLLFNRLARDSEIFIMMQGKEGCSIRTATTDSNGLFAVQDLVFPDSTTLYIQASGRNGSDNVTLVVDRESFPAPVYAPQSLLSRLNTKDESVENAFLEKAVQRVKLDEDIWTLQLDEVVITASNIERQRKLEARLQHGINAASDVTITREEIEREHYSYVSDGFILIPGVTVLGDASIRGHDERPLVLIDGIRYEWPEKGITITESNSPLEQVSIHDVERIDVFKGASAALFGMQGANGVITITTRTASTVDLNREIETLNTTVYTPLGYQKPVAFYSPKYETLQAKQSLIPDLRTTIFWKPDVVIAEDGEASFEFYTSDFKTTYSVVIEGLTNDGKIVRQVERIVVRD